MSGARNGQPNRSTARLALAIGSELFRYDNHRRADRWQPRYVIAETRVSWVIGRSRDDEPGPHWSIEKLKKSDVRDVSKKLFVWAFSREEIAEDSWIRANRYAIGEEVRRCDDYEALQKVAALVGYVSMAGAS